MTFIVDGIWTTSGNSSSSMFVAHCCDTLKTVSANQVGLMKSVTFLFSNSENTCTKCGSILSLNIPNQTHFHIHVNVHQTPVKSECSTVKYESKLCLALYLSIWQIVTALTLLEKDIKKVTELAGELQSLEFDLVTCVGTSHCNNFQSCGHKKMCDRWYSEHWDSSNTQSNKLWYRW